MSSMKKFVMPRGTGKTTQLIFMSAKNQIPILTMTKCQKDYIIEKSRTLGIGNLPDPIVIIRPEDLVFLKGRKVLIDELDLFVKYSLGIELEGYSVSIDD